jgi:NAD+ synthetase
MKEITDYGKVFETIVEKTAKYLTDNNIKAQILGISGGIDSTVCAAICHEVSKKTGIPLIGRSLPTKFNTEGETTTADLVGKAFCNDYKEVNIHGLYNRMLYFIGETEDSCLDLSSNIMYEIIGEFPKQQTLAANGNIQARLRMIYLYNLASIHRGLVMDTDNLTENNLGYFTIHGDVGDFNPIGGLWKTEVFALAAYIKDHYYFESKVHSNPSLMEAASNKAIAIEASLKLKPTAGLGITNSDLDEIGADSYDQVDYILQELLAWKNFKLSQGFEAYLSINCNLFLEEQQMLNIPYKIVENVTKKHFASEFKRNELPLKIKRYELFR